MFDLKLHSVIKTQAPNWLIHFIIIFCRLFSCFIPPNPVASPLSLSISNSPALIILERRTVSRLGLYCATALINSPRYYRFWVVEGEILLSAILYVSHQGFFFSLQKENALKRTGQRAFLHCWAKMLAIHPWVGRKRCQQDTDCSNCWSLFCFYGICSHLLPNGTAPDSARSESGSSSSSSILLLQIADSRRNLRWSWSCRRNWVTLLQGFPVPLFLHPTVL